MPDLWAAVVAWMTWGEVEPQGWTRHVDVHGMAHYPNGETRRFQ